MKGIKRLTSARTMSNLPPALEAKCILASSQVPQLVTAMFTEFSVVKRRTNASSRRSATLRPPKKTLRDHYEALLYAVIRHGNKYSTIKLGVQGSSRKFLGATSFDLADSTRDSEYAGSSPW